MKDLEETASREGHWFVVQVKPNMLARAEINLARQGYRHYTPRRTQTTRKAGRFVDRNAPLFPGYLFVKYDGHTQNWREINSTFGVSRIVSFNDRDPALVPGTVIEALRQAENAEHGSSLEQPLQPGQNVEVMRGPFAGSLARVISAPEKDRIWVLLDLLGRKTRFSVPSNAVLNT